MPDEMDDFVEFDAMKGAGVVICPSCGAKVPCSLVVDEWIECPKCGEKFKRE